MKAIIFYNETTSNSKIQIMTTEVLEGNGIKNLGGNYIVEYKNELYKGNTNYWVTKQAFDALRNQFNAVRVCL